MGTDFRRKYKNELTAFRLLGLPLIHWGIFFVFALFRAFFISFTDWNLLSEASFVGFANYIDLLTDQEMLGVFYNTIFWTVFVTIGHNLLGLAMAYMLNSIPRGEKFFRTMLYWPVLVSLVIGAEMTKYIFNPSPYGFLNTILSYFHMPAQTWYMDHRIALLSLMIFPLITGFGIKMIIYQGGLQGIPLSVYEAAEIDGATSWRRFVYITLPLIRPVILLNVVLSTIEGFRVLGPMQLVTNGGPWGATETVVLSIYKNGFVYNYMGYATAMAFILFMVIMLITLLQFRLEGEGVSYE